MEAGIHETRHPVTVRSSLQTVDLMDTGETKAVRSQDPGPVNGTGDSERDLIWVLCEDVIVLQRHRKKLKNIEALAESVKRFGVLQTLAVCPEHDLKYRLIAGERRLAAAKLAGLTRVPCRVVRDLQGQHDLLLAEVLENSAREQPDYSDIADIAELLLPTARAAARLRRDHQAGATEPLKNFSEAGNALDHVAALFNLSGPTLNMIMQVAKAGREEPAEYGDLAEKMDATRKVFAVFNELLRRQNRLTVNLQEPDEFEGVSIHTNRKGRINISISEDRTDRSAILTMFRDGMTALG